MRKSVRAKEESAGNSKMQASNRKQIPITEKTMFKRGANSRSRRFCRRRFLHFSVAF